MARAPYSRRPVLSPTGPAPAPDRPLPRRRFLSTLLGTLGGAALLGRTRRARAGVLASDPFVGELMLFCGNFAPSGWFLCDGSLLPIASYDVLFSLLGTTYGGDGQSTFAVPDLRGRIALHAGTSTLGSTYVLGQMGGSETVTLSTAQLPAHTHATIGSGTAGASDTPTGLLPARDAGGTLSWGTGTSQTPLAASHLAAAGSSQPHENRMPYLTLNWCIAWAGIYPTRP